MHSDQLVIRTHEYPKMLEAMWSVLYLRAPGPMDISRNELLLEQNLLTKLKKALIKNGSRDYLIRTEELWIGRI